MQKQIKIGWILSGTYETASSRLQGFRIHNHLKKSRFDSTILEIDFNQKHGKWSYQTYKLARKILKGHYNLVFLERPNWTMYQLSDVLRNNALKTIAIRCDLIPGEYDRYFDLTIVPTPLLKDRLKISSCAIIEDIIEPPYTKKKSVYKKTSEKLKAVWVGHPGYRNFITSFISEIKSRNNKVEFITVSKGPWATYQWSLESVYDIICECDIAIIPIPQQSDRFQIKSANRLAMFMALGMPTVATPIPSYLEFAVANENCLLADSMDEFLQSLHSLENASLRHKLGTNARKIAWKLFNSDVIGKKWIDIISYVEKQPLELPKSKLSTKIISKIIGI